MFQLIFAINSFLILFGSLQAYTLNDKPVMTFFHYFYVCLAFSWLVFANLINHHIVFRSCTIQDKSQVAQSINSICLPSPIMTEKERTCSDSRSFLLCSAKRNNTSNMNSTIWTVRLIKINQSSQPTRWLWLLSSHLTLLRADSSAADVNISFYF